MTETLYDSKGAEKREEVVKKGWMEQKGGRKGRNRGKWNQGGKWRGREREIEVKIIINWVK